MWSNYGQKLLLIAVQSGKGHICFTKPFSLKMDCKISGWRFLKYWFFYAGFYCIVFSVSEARGNHTDLAKPDLLCNFNRKHAKVPVFPDI